MMCKQQKPDRHHNEAVYHDYSFKVLCNDEEEKLYDLRTGYLHFLLWVLELESHQGRHNKEHGGHL